jgi:hypothetical protein
MSISNYICAVERCGNKLSGRARTNICPRCQAVARYWRNPERGLDAILTRQIKLDLWQARMIYLGGVDKSYAKARKVISASRSA